MKIDSFNVEQQAASKYQRLEKEYVNIQVQQFNVQDAIDISDEGLKRVDEKDELEDFLSEDDKRKIELLESFITWLTGKKFKFKGLGKVKSDDKEEKGESRPRGVGVRIHTSREFYEREAMSFQSKGQVKTADGRSIEFEVNLNMSREVYEREEMTLQVGEFHDPLVLNFDGKGVGFGDKKIRIDLDLDGQIDEFNFLNAGSGFLALDKNKNGKVDSGLELFGPQTNRGFEELRAYDEDFNSWIDENDEIFKSLKIWTVDENGEETLIGLKEAGVGAIYLSDVSSHYTLKHGDQDMAKISGSSIYLKENGEANIIHEVDIKI